MLTTSSPQHLPSALEASAQHPSEALKGMAGNEEVGQQASGQGEGGCSPRPWPPASSGLEPSTGSPCLLSAPTGLQAAAAAEQGAEVASSYVAVQVQDGDGVGMGQVGDMDQVGCQEAAPEAESHRRCAPAEMLGSRQAAEHGTSDHASGDGAGSEGAGSGGDGTGGGRGGRQALGVWGRDGNRKERGVLLLNGKPARPSTMRRVCCYVPQVGTHTGLLETRACTKDIDLLVN